MNQQNFWNDKFAKDGFLYGKEPNAFISSCLSYFDGKKSMLCLGEGEGRNAIFFAKKGFDVTAYDASNIGLEKLDLFAKQECVKVETKCLDLTMWEIEKKYDLIISSYLHLYKKDRKDFFEKIENSLEKGGYFVAEFFSIKQLNYSSGGPKDIELLYGKQEFLDNFNLCEKIDIQEKIIHIDEGRGHKGEASVVRILLKKI